MTTKIMDGTVRQLRQELYGSSPSQTTPVNRVNRRVLVAMLVVAVIGAGYRVIRTPSAPKQRVLVVHPDPLFQPFV